MKEKYNQLSAQNKALVKMLGIVILIVLLFILAIVVIAIKNGGKKSNSQVEDIMEKAAAKYVADNEDLFSDVIYGSKEVTIDTLVEGKYMNPLKSYYRKDTTCDGKVLIYKNLDYYNYTAKLDCGSDYVSKSLYDEITNPKNIVTEESGLYEYNDRYVYRGEYVDNYVSFAGMTWRIISVSKNGEIKIFQNDSLQETAWDDRYNSDYRETTGINLFEATESSRLKEAILAAYNDTSVFTNQAKSYIIPKQYCTGKRSESNTSKDYSAECSNKSELMGAGTLVVADFLNASLDSKCNATTDRACYNYNYMAKLKRSTWTMTADSSNTKKAYSINYKVDTKSLTNQLTLRLVVTINGNVKYKKGTGTLEDPYIVG